jgi:hypothetical protein
MLVSGYSIKITLDSRLQVQDAPAKPNHQQYSSAHSQQKGNTAHKIHHIEPMSG